MNIDKPIEEVIRDYPFLNYIREDKSRYTHAKDVGYIDPNDSFLIGDSGGFLLNINADDEFIDVHLLTEAADFFRANKAYSFYKEDTIPHRQFRKREEYRRKNGYTAPCLIRNGKVMDITISGSMYNYLNYILIQQLDTKTATNNGKVAVGKKIYDFPKFIDAQYWTFEIMNFCRNNGFNLIIDKTRRGGFSYIMASDTANNVNLNPKKVCINVAADKKYLTKTGGLTDFAINNLRFFETRTPFVRGIFSTDKENFKLGFKLPNGVESPKSWGSTLFSVSAMNNPDCAIGKDSMDTKVEELSTMENFDDFMAVTEPAMRTGSYLTGNLFAWGTATSGNMQVFERNFYAPKAFNFMPFENVWDKDCRNEICGYFKPYVWGLQGEDNGKFALDENGNSDLETAIRIAYKERKNKKENSKTFSDYVNYLGQYANMPSESFSSTTENLFSSEELLAWEERLRTDNAFTFYVDGVLVETNDKVEFRTNARIAAEGGKHNVDFYDWINGVPRKGHEHPHGCIRKWFNPLKTNYIDRTGKECFGTPPGMYSITYDPVGINKENKEVTLRHSHNSIKVWMNPCKYNGFKTALVCAYYGRTEKLEEADRICYNLARYYNCIGTVGVEVNRGETVSNFSKWKALNYLMKDPVDIWDTKIKTETVSHYGINMGSEFKKLEGLRLLKEMLYSVIGKDEKGNDIKLYQTIYDYQSILELKKWNNLGNFDRVSEMLLRGIQWRYANVEAAKELEHRKKIVKKDRSHILERDWF